jgi:hypothetical protein
MEIAPRPSGLAAVRRRRAEAAHSHSASGGSVPHRKARLPDLGALGALGDAIPSARSGSTPVYYQHPNPTFCP